MGKIAILHVPHEQCEASLQEMLLSIGYNVFGIGRDLSHRLNLHMKPVVASRLPVKAGLDHFRRCELFVTVKHYNIPGIYKRHPHIKDKLLWFDINGGIPGVHIPQAPQKTYPSEVPIPYVSANKHYADDSGHSVSGPRYICYIPLPNQDVYLKAAHFRKVADSPICLVHNAYHWGYGILVDELRSRCGVRFFGSHKSPDGLLSSAQVVSALTRALCLVHVKSRDCPGIALYEALFTGCPVILTDVFLQRTLYTDLYEDGETCLVVKDSPLSPIDERKKILIDQIAVCIDRLKDPKENVRIGSNGRRRLVQLMWQSNRPKDVDSFRKFMAEQFP
jgi:glycosyltransferase involved in cell wall biosynthesis